MYTFAAKRNIAEKKNVTGRHSLDVQFRLTLSGPMSYVSPFPCDIHFRFSVYTEIFFHSFALPPFVRSFSFYFTIKLHIVGRSPKECCLNLSVVQ